MLHPIVVDLDGTLIHTDMLHESALKLFREKPLKVIQIPFWLSKGKAFLKEKLASIVQVSPESLPFNTELIEWLKERKTQGHSLVLCTASDQSIASSISQQLGIFDEVIASDGKVNLSSHHKADELVKRYGEKKFDYIGNSNADLAVWSKAKSGVVVQGSSALIEKAKAICSIEKTFNSNRINFTAVRRLFRFHQWLKNLLIFVPLFAAHEINRTDHWISLLMAFFAFNCCASSVYMANDLMDLESDRLHPRKRSRPFASGVIPVSVGVFLIPISLAVSFTLASFVGIYFVAWLGFYFILTCSYSWHLKRMMLLDCLVLAMLYTIRIISGATAVGHQLSFWLLGFSVFLFLSLAYVKRYAEIYLLSDKEKVHGRGYQIADASLIQTMGIASGYASVLVLALYLNSDQIIKLYQFPEFAWGAVPIMLFWISWMWMQAHRGLMHDDPLVFAVKDKASLIAGALFTVVVFIASTGLPWLQ